MKPWIQQHKSLHNQAGIVLDVTDIIELENTLKDHSVCLPAQKSISPTYGTPDNLSNLFWNTFKTGDFMIIQRNLFQCFTTSIVRKLFLTS